MVKRYFIENSGGILSASAMLKTSIVLSEMIAAGFMSPYDDSTEDENIKLEDLIKTNKGFLNWLGSLIKFFVFKLAMIVAMVLIMIEYAMCIIEFFIVTALSSLLIPLMFLEATKSYAMNILKIVISYFMKILTTTVLCFFVLNMYINCLTDMVAEDMSMIIWIIYYLYVIMLGLVLVKSSGKIVSSILSGNPSLGVSDITHQGHGMFHAARAGYRMGGAYAKEVGKAVQGTGKTVANAANTLDGARIANWSALQEGARFNEDREAHGGATISQDSINQAGRKARSDFIKGKMGQSFKDTLWEKGTGQKAERTEDDMKFGNIGQTYIDETGREQKMSRGMARKENTKVANKLGKKAFDDLIGDKTKEADTSTLNMNNQKIGTQEFPKPNVRGREVGLPDLE